MGSNMNKIDIRELREETGLTQKAFADMYEIPVSTLRKWEQHEAAPPEYVLKLIARTLPGTDKNLICIEGKDGERYYYDSNKSLVADKFGNQIIISEDLSDIKKQNLTLYLKDLFDTFYEARDRFERDCRFDRQEDIIWS